MAVSNYAMLQRSFIAPGLYTALAQVTGDASGGNGEVRILFPREKGVLWYIDRLTYRGRASVSNVIVGLYGGWSADPRWAPGSSSAQLHLLATDSSGYVSPAQSRDLARVLSPLWWSGEPTALLPYLQVYDNNVDTTQYLLGVMAWRVDPRILKTGFDDSEAQFGLLPALRA